ncbi:MAG: glucuronate isomerase [Chitinophagaceae bacterium]
MINSILNDHFLLQNAVAERLYHTVAKDLPIVDYHNHINTQHIAINKRFTNLAELWITGDPYKHRAMRINGIPEEGITGNASAKDKYYNWVKTLPKTIGNPLFHWNCLELKRIFGINELLTEKNAEEVWDACNSNLQQEGFGASGILQKWNTEIICTSDDLADDLQAHQAIAVNSRGTKVLPSLRGDSIMAFESPVNEEWMKEISRQFGTIESLEEYEEAIKQRLDHFANHGCRLADHSLDAGFAFSLPGEAVANRLFTDFKHGIMLSNDNIVLLKSYLLHFLGGEYCKRGWVMQLHIGAQRYTSSRLRKLAGSAGGYATIGKTGDIASLCLFLDGLEMKDLLPRTILYTLNPSDNAAFATLTGSFAEDGKAGKIQFGPAWWYNDHYEGIRHHLLSIAAYGLLAHFIGMTTDSRSLLSFSRHEYFRRILCNVVGTWIQAGELPDDTVLIHDLIKNICYNNSKKFIFNS